MDLETAWQDPTSAARPAIGRQWALVDEVASRGPVAATPVLGNEAFASDWRRDLISFSAAAETGAEYRGSQRNARLR